MRWQRELKPEHSSLMELYLKKVEIFKYLRRQTSSRDSDAPALFMNLAKVRRRLAQIFNLIAREGDDSAIGGRIYVAAVLAVLLYSLETWVWTSSMLNSIRGFHHCACQRLADKRPRRQQNGTNWYCPADEAMRICKLSPIQVYIARRRQTVLAFVVKRPIYKLCREGVRGAGTPTRTKFWWEQDLSNWIELTKDDYPKGRLIHGAGVLYMVWRLFGRCRFKFLYSFFLIVSFISFKYTVTRPKQTTKQNKDLEYK